jgi:phospho-N-acetylmuramoyl-pentapeptide-transferase
VLLTYTAIAFITGGQDGLSITEQDGLSLLGACLVGASVGFLWFNSFPAAIFMGDTGSLGLGGAIAGMAVMTKSEVLLIVIGGIFVIEALSVAAQVFTFRVFRRRMVGDEDHRAVLDHGRDRERDRLHALPAEHWRLVAARRCRRVPTSS